VKIGSSCTIFPDFLFANSCQATCRPGSPTTQLFVKSIVDGLMVGSVGQRRKEKRVAASARRVCVCYVDVGGHGDTGRVTLRRCRDERSESRQPISFISRRKSASHDDHRRSVGSSERKSIRRNELRRAACPDRAKTPWSCE